MTTIDAIYTRGVFKPLNHVALPENQRVRLSVETAEAPTTTTWLAMAQQFQQHIIAQHGVLPDSTPDIAAERRRHA